MKIIKVLGKAVAAGIMAILILSLISYFYSQKPIHIHNAKGNTDYVWQKNARWMQMTEGISWGRYDESGYNNLSVVDSPDILVLGSSHIEAVNVMQDENAVSLLNDYLDGKYTAYNLGISGHHFIKVCKYLPVTMKLYENTPKYIVIETSTTSFLQKDVDALLQGTIDFTGSRENGIVASLQKVPFLRLTYHQLTGGLLKLFMPAKTTKPAVAQSQSVVSAHAEIDTAPYDALFQYIGGVMENYDTHVIIVYHDFGKLQADGSVVYQPAESVECFADKCDEYGISFLNMVEPFEEMYASEKKVPYGFVTGRIGEGHLNANGHKAIAQELKKLIEELE